MFNGFVNFSSYINFYFEFLNPTFWLSIGAIIFVLGLIGLNPIKEQSDSNFGEMIGIKTRQILLVALFGIIFLYPFFIVMFAAKIYENQFDQFLNFFFEKTLDSFLSFWTIPLAALISSYLISFSFERYMLPKLSALGRRFRVRQSGDELSDIRMEKDKLKAKDFLPKKYYKKGYMFYGLNQNNKPIYDPIEKWKKQNVKIIGPTQTGKGVEIGVQLDQAIRKNMTVFFLDPKPDHHAAHIMYQACQETGRNFIYLDLNDGTQGTWSPFSGGTFRDRRSRLHFALGLNDTGKESDFYKASEREIIDQEIDGWSGSINDLIHKLQKQKDLVKRTLSNLSEWKQVDTFHPKQNKGFSIEKSLEENAVVYIRASIDDQIVVKAATLFIMETVQELKRLFNDGRRKEHFYFCIDEVRFMISDMLADALATVVGFNSTFHVAYQSILDIRNLKDANLNAQAIEQSVNINCKTTLCYMAADSETAEWASLLSGTIQKTVSRMEEVRVTRHGAELWSPDRTLNKAEENLIPENMMKMLPERIGALFRPNELAIILHSCWIPVEKRYTPRIKNKEDKSPKIETIEPEIITTKVKPVKKKTEKKQAKKKPEIKEPLDMFDLDKMIKQSEVKEEKRKNNQPKKMESEKENTQEKEFDWNNI